MTPWPILAGAGALLVLLAAKAHGRQVRLERELEGYAQVTFGARNPPFVEALWRRDRIRFWSTLPVLALALGGGIALAGRVDLALLGALAGAPALAFSLAGLLSFRNLRAQIRARGEARVREERGAAWLARATRGSLAYWALVALAMAATAAVALIA